MNIKERLENDLKQAMLAGDKLRAETIRGLKSAVLNVEIAENSRDQGLSDDGVTIVLQKEAKKRTESAELYVKGGSQDKADKELAEKKIIEEYLPEQLSREDIESIVDEAISSLDAKNIQDMGRVMAAVKQKAGASADGAVVAEIVKSRLS